MHAGLHGFLARLAATIAMSLVPVALIAFLSMPMCLGRHPGEPLLDANAPAGHMT